MGKLYEELKAGALRGGAGGGGGGGFTPTDAQLAAMNSGITEERVEELAGIEDSGEDYIEIGGIRLYVSATAPTGARTGDLWIGG